MLCYILIIDKDLLYRHILLQDIKILIPLTLNFITNITMKSLMKDL